MADLLLVFPNYFDLAQWPSNVFSEGLMNLVIFTYSLDCRNLRLDCEGPIYDGFKKSMNGNGGVIMDYRFVKIKYKSFDSSKGPYVEKINLSKVGYSDGGLPLSFEDVKFSTIREYRDAFKIAIKEPIEEYFSENGIFILSTSDATWVWQKNITEEELYSVYGGD